MAGLLPTPRAKCAAGTDQPLSCACPLPLVGAGLPANGLAERLRGQGRSYQESRVGLDLMSSLWERACPRMGGQKAWQPQPLPPCCLPPKQSGLTSFYVAECKFLPLPPVRHWIVGRSVAIMAGDRRGATDILRTEVHRSENTSDVTTRHDHLRRCPGGSAD